MAFTLRPTAEEEKVIEDLMALLGKGRKSAAVMAAAKGYRKLLEERNDLERERNALVGQLVAVARADESRRAGLESAAQAEKELEKALKGASRLQVRSELDRSALDKLLRDVAAKDGIAL